jgi:hypothetical protein
VEQFLASNRNSDIYIFHKTLTGKAYPKEWKIDAVCQIYKNKIGSLTIAERSVIITSNRKHFSQYFGQYTE